MMQRALDAVVLGAGFAIGAAAAGIVLRKLFLLPVPRR